MQQYYDLLKRNPEFRRLWSAQVISLLGDWFNTIVLSTLVATYTDGSGLAISLFLMARFLPPLLIGPFAGVLVDRYNRQTILVYCNIVRTVVVLGFLTVTSAERLWIIYALTIIQFSLSALFEPGQSAITPSLVKRHDLVLANTLASVTWSVMLAFGAIIGGIVAAALGYAIALLIDAITFAVAGWLIHSINYQPVKKESTEPEADTPATETDMSFRAGLTYLRRNPTTAAILLIKGGGSIGNVDTLMTVFATQVFIMGQSGELSLSIMYSAFGIGAVLGPLMLNRINDGSTQRMRRLVTVGFVWITLSWLLMGTAASLLVLCLALVLRAMGGSANWTYSSVILQKTVPDHYLGRVTSLDYASFQLITVVSSIAHGWIIDVVGVNGLTNVIFATTAVAIIPLAVWARLLPRMERQELKPAAIGD